MGHCCGFTNNAKMAVISHDKCLQVLQKLRVNWTRNPEDVLDKKLKTVGLETEILITDMQLLKDSKESCTVV